MLVETLIKWNWVFLGGGVKLPLARVNDLLNSTLTTTSHNCPTELQTNQANPRISFDRCIIFFCSGKRFSPPRSQPRNPIALIPASFNIEATCSKLARPTCCDSPIPPGKSDGGVPMKCKSGHRLDSIVTCLPLMKQSR